MDSGPGKEEKVEILARRALERSMFSLLECQQNTYSWDSTFSLGVAKTVRADIHFLIYSYFEIGTKEITV